MRRTTDKSKSFKGSVFAEFGSVADAEEFTKTCKEASTPLEYEGKPITHVLMRGEYFAQKRQERDQRMAKEQAEVDAELFKDFQKRKVPGSILKVKGLPSHVQWPDMQQSCSKVVKVRFTELSEEDSDAAFIRLSSTEDAQTLLLALNELVAAKAKVDEAKGKEGEDAKDGAASGLSEVQLELLGGFGGIAPAAEVLAGEEEDAYWEKVFIAQKDRIRLQAMRNKKRGRGGQPLKGKGGPRSAAASGSGAAPESKPTAGEEAAEGTSASAAAEEESADEPKAKKAKTEAGAEAAAGAAEGTSS